MKALLAIPNASAVPLDRVPLLELDAFRMSLVVGTDAGLRVSALFARPLDDRLELVAVLADDRAGLLRCARTRLDDEWPSLVPGCPQVHLFEREIAEQWGVRIVGHPWL